MARQDYGFPVAGFEEEIPPETLKIAKQQISKSETIAFCLIGTNGQCLFALPERLLIVKTGFAAGHTFGGQTVGSFNYRDITGIEISTGLMVGEIAIGTASNMPVGASNLAPNKLPMSKKGIEQCRPYLDDLRERVTKAKSGTLQRTAPPDSLDLAAQLEKLAALKTSGALTDEEFNVAKARVLGTTGTASAESGEGNSGPAEPRLQPSLKSGQETMPAVPEAILSTEAPAAPGGPRPEILSSYLDKRSGKSTLTEHELTAETALAWNEQRAANPSKQGDVGYWGWGCLISFVVLMLWSAWKQIFDTPHPDSQPAPQPAAVSSDAGVGTASDRNYIGKVYFLQAGQSGGIVLGGDKADMAEAAVDIAQNRMGDYHRIEGRLASLEDGTRVQVIDQSKRLIDSPVLYEVQVRVLSGESQGQTMWVFSSVLGSEACP